MKSKRIEVKSKADEIEFKLSLSHCGGIIVEDEEP